MYFGDYPQFSLPFSITFIKNKKPHLARTQNAVKSTTQFVQALASQGDEITLSHTLSFRYDLLTC